jgi:hypothetical protein
MREGIHPEYTRQKLHVTVVMSLLQDQQKKRFTLRFVQSVIRSIPVSRKQLQQEEELRSLTVDMVLDRTNKLRIGLRVCIPLLQALESVFSAYFFSYGKPRKRQSFTSETLACYFFSYGGII